MHNTAQAISADKLGFTADKLGAYSMRSSVAMSMFLDNAPVFLIVLIGYCSSNAFLKYIYKQELEI